MRGPNTPSRSNQEAGETRGQGFVISLDEDAGVIRFKRSGKWYDLDAARARGLADHLESMPIDNDPRAYDIQGNFIGSAIDRLHEYAEELEEDHA